jgi:hypothetical protein
LKRRKKMDNNQSNIDVKNYLVTQKADCKEFSKNRVQSDLENLKKAEIRSQKRVSITRNMHDGAIKRAMSALSLNNPFKGI